jgi:hypothetical protein
LRARETFIREIALVSLTPKENGNDKRLVQLAVSTDHNKTTIKASNNAASSAHPIFRVRARVVHFAGAFMCYKSHHEILLNELQNTALSAACNKHKSISQCKSTFRLVINYIFAILSNRRRGHEAERSLCMVREEAMSACEKNIERLFCLQQTLFRCKLNFMRLREVHVLTQHGRSTEPFFSRESLSADDIWSG